ncbi:butyrophilin-like protein 2 isoform X2 [Brachyhypopomus gauderio]|uniref:butyrophilin-like protein 2 isoform X2 n=1 Tax=Brachyhypopomus gauderio TaxID=698409 RepID=UPI004041C701
MEGVVMILLLHWSLSGAQQFDLEGGGVVVAAAGSDVTLPCSLKNQQSAVDMEVEWTRPDLKNQIVHHYKNKQDQTDKLDPSYKNRTSLFKEELQQGNTSLLLKKVQESDGGQYKCLVQSTGAFDEITINLTVEAIGTPPEIFVLSTDGSGGISLLCETTGWNPKPELRVLDSKGVELSGEHKKSQRAGVGFNVSLDVTAHKNATDTVTCKMTWRDSQRETQMDITGIGSNPQIIVEGTDVSGGIKLLCETTGWKSEPQLQWFSGGVELPAGDVENLQDNNLYTVRYRITTHKNGIFICRVKQHPRMKKDISVILDNSGNKADIGTPPEISVLGTDGSGGISLLCETTGWNPEPELRVLNSNRVELSGGYKKSHRARVGFNVSLHVTAHGTPTVTCEMKLGQHKWEKQMNITGIGTNPQIIVEGTDVPGGIRLLCETTGWESEPHLQWFIGGREHLPGDVETHNDGLYTVRHSITADSGTNIFTCRIKKHPRMEKVINISDHLSNRWKHVAIGAIIVVLIIGAGVAVWRVWRHCRRQRDSVPTMSAVYKPAPTNTPGGAEETNGLNTPVTNDG